MAGRAPRDVRITVTQALTNSEAPAGRAGPMVEPEAHPLIRTPGSRVGLLLGAGGIRGCAHAGVLSVLESAGIQPGIVVGASIGSLFGAAYAAEWPVERIERITYGAPRGAVAEFYKHRLRIDSSTYIGRILCELGADTRIEHLPRRYACMAIDCHRSTGRIDSRPVARQLGGEHCSPRHRETGHPGVGNVCRWRASRASPSIGRSGPWSRMGASCRADGSRAPSG